MSFCEGSARVPLIVRAPRWFGPGWIAAPASAMDLLPTLAGLVQAGSLPEVIGPLDGRSLLPHLSGAPDRDEVVAECLAEGAIAPIVMIRRGNYKFIHSPAGPDQLFDLEPDPHERVNLADDPASAELAGRFRQEIAARWDLAAVDHEVRLSQQRRLGRHPRARHRRADPTGLRPGLRRGPALHP
jgi:choline-sulfatase